MSGTFAIFVARRTSFSNDKATVQRELAARREEWWRRFTFAAELATDADERKRVAGLMLLTALANSPLAGTDEVALLDVFQERVLEGGDLQMQDRDDEGDSGRG